MSDEETSDVGTESSTEVTTANGYQPGGGIQSRYWCFTHNNPSPTYDPSTLHWQYDYLVVGREVGQQGTPHIQGYIVLKSRKRLHQLRTVDPRSHFEAARGSPEHNRAYCTKDGNFQEYGTFPNSRASRGRESSKERWEEIHSLAKAGDTATFLREYPFESFMYMPKFVALVATYRVHPSTITVLDNKWYYGPSGSGKSSAARRNYPGCYIKPTTTKWWPNYGGEDTVLLDDVDQADEHVLKYLKVWTDHYSFQAEVKGGHTGLIRPERFIVTSQYLPEHITVNAELRAAIQRRFTVVRFGEDTYVPESVPTGSALFNGSAQFDW